MVECSRVDCGKTATHYLTLVVPPRHYPMERGVTLVVGLVTCRPCGADTVVADILLGEGRARIDKMVKVAHRSTVPLDWDRAEVRIRPLHDDMWRKFLAMRAQGEGGGNA